MYTCYTNLRVQIYKYIYIKSRCVYTCTVALWESIIHGRGCCLSRRAHQYCPETDNSSPLVDFVARNCPIKGTSSSYFPEKPLETNLQFDIAGRIFPVFTIFRIDWTLLNSDSVSLCVQYIYYIYSDC